MTRDIRFQGRLRGPVTLTPVAERLGQCFRAWKDHYRAITAMTRDLLSLLHLVDERNANYQINTFYNKKKTVQRKIRERTRGKWRGTLIYPFY